MRSSSTTGRRPIRLLPVPGRLAPARDRPAKAYLHADDCFFGQWTAWDYLIWTVDDGVAHARDPEPHVEQSDLRALDEPLDLGTDSTYQLFSGPLDAAQRVGNWPNEHTFEAHAPDLIWPQDRAWCVRRDGDSDTIVAGTPAVIHEITTHRELDARHI
jgi:hypothetical protein